MGWWRRAGGRASPSACVGWVPAAALHAGAGTETCWHPGAAAGDAAGCSLRPQGPSPTSSVLHPGLPHVSVGAPISPGRVLLRSVAWVPSPLVGALAPWLG